MKRTMAALYSHTEACWPNVRRTSLLASTLLLIPLSIKLSTQQNIITLVIDAYPQIVVLFVEDTPAESSVFQEKI